MFQRCRSFQSHSKGHSDSCSVFYSPGGLEIDFAYHKGHVSFFKLSYTLLNSTNNRTFPPLGITEGATRDTTRKLPQLVAAGSMSVSNSTSTVITVGWVEDAPQRGTLSIITSCILTMGLCVWSALHLNIPPKIEKTARCWTRNFRWMLLGLFAPELVVFTAWRQYISAKTLQLRVNSYSADLPKSTNTSKVSDIFIFMGVNMLNVLR